MLQRIGSSRLRQMRWRHGVLDVTSAIALAAIQPEIVAGGGDNLLYLARPARQAGAAAARSRRRHLGHRRHGLVRLPVGSRRKLANSKRTAASPGMAAKLIRR